MDKIPEDIKPLIEILGEKDNLQASLAMQQLLQTPDAMQVVSACQDTGNTLLRKRIQQFSSLLNQNYLALHILHDIEKQEVTAWDIFCEINVFLDRQASLRQIHEMLFAFLGTSNEKIRSTRQLADILLSAELAPVPALPLNHCLIEYLPADVLYSRYGSPLVLAVIAEKTAFIHNWTAKVGFINGSPVVRDASFNILDPSQNWAISHPSLEAFQPASKRDLAIRLLTFLVSMSIQEQIHSVTFNALALLTHLTLKQPPSQKNK